MGIKVTTMPVDEDLHWKNYMESTFLGKHHFEVFAKGGSLTDKGLLVTIDKVVKKEISHKGRKETKPAVLFKETNVLPFLLGPEKFQQLEQIFQSPHAKDWKGKKVYLYIDHGVKFGREAVGGIRFRMHMEAPKATSGPKPIEEKNMDKAIQFAIAKGMDALLKNYMPTPTQQKIIEDAIAKAKG